MVAGPTNWAEQLTVTELDQVNRVVAAAQVIFGLSREQLLGHLRRRELVKARHATIAVLRETTGLSYPILGAIFDGRDHTTMMHAVERAEPTWVESLRGEMDE